MKGYFLKEVWMRKSVLIVLTMFLFTGLKADSFLNKTFMTGEFLWWTAESDSFGPFSFYLNESVTPTHDEYTPYAFKYGYRPGYRVGIETEICLCDTHFAPYATWTSFRTTSALDVDFVLTTSSSFYEIDPVSAYFLLLGGAAITDVGDTLNYHGTTDFLYNRLDVGVSKVVYEGSCLSIVPKAAFTYVHLRQTLQERLFQIADSVPILNVGNSQSHFSAGGITLGFDSNYLLGLGFSFYSNLSATGVVGETQTNFSFAAYNGTEPIEANLTFTGSSPANMQVGRWLTDVQVGLQFETCFSNWFQVAARVGWQFVYLPEQLYFSQETRPRSVKINGLVAGLGVGF